MCYQFSIRHHIHLVSNVEVSASIAFYAVNKTKFPVKIASHRFGASVHVGVRPIPDVFNRAKRIDALIGRKPGFSPQGIPPLKHKYGLLGPELFRVLSRKCRFVFCI